MNRITKSPLTKLHPRERFRYARLANIVSEDIILFLAHEDVLGDAWEALTDDEQMDISIDMTKLVAEKMLQYFERTNN